MASIVSRIFPCNTEREIRKLTEVTDRLAEHIDAHVLDLRREIDELRAQAGLPPKDWPPVSNRGG